MEDVHRELVSQLTRQDFIGRLDDGATHFGVQQAQVRVGHRRRPLHVHKGFDHARVLGQSADAEKLATALGLASPIRVGGDVNVAQTVLFDAGAHTDLSLGEPFPTA